MPARDETDATNAHRRLTRRELVGLGALLGLSMSGSVLAACATTAQAPAATAPAAGKPTTAPASAGTAPPAASATAPTAQPAAAPTTAQPSTAAPSGILTIAQGVDAESLDP